jgi:hypothetical protein
VNSSRAFQPRPEPPAAQLEAAAASFGFGRPQVQTNPPPPSLAPTQARRPARLPHRIATSPAQRSRQPPPLDAGAPTSPVSPCPTEPRNRLPRTRGSIPARARPVPAGGSPEFGRTAAGRCSGTALRSHNSF